MKVLYLSFVYYLVAELGSRDVVVDAFTYGSSSPSMLVKKSAPFSSSLQQSTAEEEEAMEDVSVMTLEQKRQEQKKALIGLFGGGSASKMALVDPVLACPETKEPLSIQTSGAILGSDMNTGVKVSLSSGNGSSDKLLYSGRTNTYYNLLEPSNEAAVVDNDDTSGGDQGKSDNQNALLRNLQVFVPPPLRPVFANVFDSEEYIPMRDLFTSPSVSFAYERGWRQGFAAAGFPGADKEYDMVREYFEPVTVSTPSSTVVDMSCATGKLPYILQKLS